MHGASRLRVQHHSQSLFARSLPWQSARTSLYSLSYHGGTSRIRNAIYGIRENSRRHGRRIRSVQCLHHRQAIMSLKGSLQASILPLQSSSCLETATSSSLTSRYDQRPETSSPNTQPARNPRERYLLKPMLLPGQHSPACLTLLWPSLAISTSFAQAQGYSSRHGQVSGDLQVQKKAWTPWKGAITQQWISI